MGARLALGRFESFEMQLKWCGAENWPIPLTGSIIYPAQLSLPAAWEVGGFGLLKILFWLVTQLGNVAIARSRRGSVEALGPSLHRASSMENNIFFFDEILVYEVIYTAHKQDYIHSA